MVLPKRVNLSLIKPLNPAVNFPEIQRTEEHVQLQHNYAISTTQIVVNSPGQMPWILPHTNYKEQKRRKGELIKGLQRHDSFLMKKTKLEYLGIHTWVVKI